MHEKCKITYIDVIIMCLLLIFAASAVLTGFLLYQQGSGPIGRLNRQHTIEHRRATETIGNLTTELERERELNRELRDYNNQARAIAGGLTGTTERNVRNLQEAIGLISEIRTKLKVLADFYADSSPGDSAH